MAQNVVINGVTYSNVPEVDIPKSGSGTAKFYDTSTRNTSTSSILSAGLLISHNSDSTTSSGTSYTRYWASPTDFHPYSNSSSRYWRAGRTFKWIAIWKP